MSSFLIGPSLVGVIRLVSSTLLAGLVASPMSWSPDGEWLGYTVMSRPNQVRLHPGWLFDASRDASVSIGGEPTAHAGLETVLRPSSPDRIVNKREQTDRGAFRLAGSANHDPPLASRHSQRSSEKTEDRPIYQLWATSRDGRQSVLIAHSESPVSAPSWSPLGRAVAYGRFVPKSIESSQTAERLCGRYEVVVQDRLDGAQVIWASPEVVVGPEARTEIPQFKCAWSPDGTYLAVSRPGSRPSVVIVRADTRKCVHILEHAILPAWSPDGRTCAYIHTEDDYNTLAVVERDGANFGASRQLVATGRFTAPVYWSSDGRSIYVILEKSRARSHEPELARVFAESGDVVRMPFALAPEPIRRMAAIRGIVFDFDRDAERCFHSVDLEGRDTDVACTALRDRFPVTFKRFPPLDPSQRIGAIAGSPDGRLVAVRFATADGLTPPVLYDLETDQPTLIVPDLAAQREWQAALSATASRLIRAGLPPATIDGAPCIRPTLLPLPGELSMLDGVGQRVSRLGRHAMSLLERPHDRKTSDYGLDENDARAVTEARLAFSYLEGDFGTAASELARLESQVCTLEHRIALLGVRAQILWSRGDRPAARGVVDYLLSVTADQTHHVDETALGVVLTRNPNPSHDWARLLAKKFKEVAEPSAQPYGDNVPEPPDPAFPNLFGPPDGLLPDRGGGAIPFAPIFPDLWGRDLERLFAPDAADFPRFDDAHRAPPASSKQRSPVKAP
jgi:hypothetical protein